jgi:hypothetical protein
MGVKVTNFRKFEKNSLRGFLSIHLTGVGLEIRDATYHKKGRKRWIGLPAKPYKDKEGETKYAYIVKFVDKDRWQEFQKYALEALDEYLAEKGGHTPDDDIPL